MALFGPLMADPTFLLYGANGFTGALIAERARERGLTPILAGRNREAVTAVGARLGLPTRIFDLDAPEHIDEGLRGVRLVLHCAGPYSQTGQPMVDGCLRARAHYLDITGETGALAAVLARDAEARQAGCVLLPAVGFDVVPTDCMAARLHGEMPDAVQLELGFGGGAIVSPGTAKTAVEGLHMGATVRQAGVLVKLPKPRTRTLPFKSGEVPGVSIPWGDLVTAFHSTGIPNIIVYAAIPPKLVKMSSLLRFAEPFLRMPAIVRFLQKRVLHYATGPTEEQRQTCRMSVWGRVENAAGAALEGHLDLPEGYELTVVAALDSVARVLAGAVKPGATTPSRAFGADYVTTLPGSGRFELSRHMSASPPDANANASARADGPAQGSRVA